MYEYYSVGDGFAEITENVGELITYVANEPSVGLYYIQQHAKDAAITTTNLNNNIADHSHKTSLQADDLGDSIAAMSAMKKCGHKITDEMIVDIEKSLSMILTKQRSSLMQNPRSNSIKIGRTRSWIPSKHSHSAGDMPNENLGSYLSMVFNSAKGKSGKFRWVGLDQTASSVSASGSEVGLAAPENEETEELPLSIHASGDVEDGVNGVGKNHYELSASENYEVLEADKKVRLEKWLKDNNAS